MGNALKLLPAQGAEKTSMRTGDEDRIARIKQNGLECLGRLHGDQTWEDWQGVAAAMEIITEEALAAVGASQWDKDNKHAVKEFNRRWDDYETSAGTNHKPLSKQEHWAVREVMSKPEISAFRSTLTGPAKRRLNHPNAVINRFNGFTRDETNKTIAIAIIGTFDGLPSRISRVEAIAREMLAWVTAQKKAAPSKAAKA